MLQYEITRRGLYINRITNYIKGFVENCETCIIHKLNNFIKPEPIQIISNYPLERVQIDITYFNKKIELEDLHYKYLLNFTDHFSKYSKGYLLENKTSELVLEKLKHFIKEVGRPKIIQTDNGSEFSSNKFILFCKENSIKLTHSSPYHPKSKGSVEEFNKNIIAKIRYLKLEQKDKFNIIEGLNKAFNTVNL